MPLLHRTELRVDRPKWTDKLVPHYWDLRDKLGVRHPKWSGVLLLEK